MSKRTKSALCAAVLTCAGVAAFAATGFGDDPAPSSRTVKVAMTPVAGAPSHELTLNRGKRRGPRVINLITSRPVQVPPDASISAEMTCKKKEGIPIGGGVLAPPPPATVNVISRFSPQHPDRLKPRTYYAGISNSGDETVQFNGTLVCAKGIDQVLP